MALIAGGPPGRTHAAPRPVLAPTPQQEAFYGAVRSGTSHVLLVARAGSGKSTSSAEAMHRLPRSTRIIYCAFNKTIADEFAEKAPAHCRSATMHSLGFAMIRDALGRVEIDNDKTETLAERYFPRRFDDRMARFAVGKLVSLCKNLLDDGRDADGLRQMAADFDVQLGKDAADVLAVVPEVLAESRELTGSIDFDDMIWLPVALGLSSRSPADVLFVDEAQDTNACQMALMERLCPRGRFVVVGDPEQAIYAFRGASSDAVDAIARRLEASRAGLVRLPLTVTWRCPRAHVALANAIVPDLEAAPAARPGEVVELDHAAALAALLPGDMVLCRTNAPLVGACYRLLRDGRRAVVRGRDVGKGMLALIARLRPGSVPDLVARIEDYRVRETRSLNELRNPGPALVALGDRVGCLMALADGAATVEEVKSRIERLFSDDDERGAVVFSSIHRAKGLERDRIAILHPEQLPHPAASSAVDHEQERHLAYVAATRSKHSLTFAGGVPAILQPAAGTPGATTFAFGD